ncbi:hypothetical protein LTR10_017606 [Elasticomyces elasticus]|uniref:Uncharacterized protein n=1 Tax=Exophiala sideris TaxID=1016849 RepID=A0ABR0JP22_9EURO|nr:hypothetical protein LTR10_017606 [Elasticomyces elasticus]KAK5038251.1 hypothetical protein LTS07_001721 [Exophiala sideris]KAK5044235.1 hypothetical protein LTR13_000591 [Exophiala sideris]KAK5067735.1 hypothetical protein LTR69_001724 [Exophiala sideris]
MQVQYILSTIAQVAAFLIGLMAVAAGARGILKPNDFAASFGLPSTKSPAWMNQNGSESMSEKDTERPATPASTSESQSENPFIAVVGVRNIALGLSLLVFTLMRNTHATGVLLLCNQVSMIGDTITCQRKGTPGSSTHHIVAGVVFALLGGYMVAAK